MITVLSVGYPLAPVGPDAVGGAEQVLSAIDLALVEAGHRSIVIAPETSRIAGELVALRWPRVELSPDVVAHAQGATRDAIETVLATRHVDVVHFHGVDFPTYVPRKEVRALATLHLPPSLYPRWIFDDARLDLTCVSASQAASCPSRARVAAIVPNGVDVGVLRPRGRKRAFALALGRICPEKGHHVALDAAARAGMPIVLGGEVFRYPAHEAYFERCIRPRLGRGAVFAGPLGVARKARLLAAARCLLVPSAIDETSSLVAMEALASGTPVVAFRRGALPEVVEDCVTGFVVDDVEEMTRALGRVAELDPDACRATAERRFSRRVMTGRYLELLETLARR